MTKIQQDYLSLLELQIARMEVERSQRKIEQLLADTRAIADAIKASL